jgi:redox-sensitive bicupin YhaK (pirin superfamily)
MCDHFGPTNTLPKVDDPDTFPVDWHPHRGMDILTYIVEGVGRHADSLGNRGEFGMFNGTHLQPFTGCFCVRFFVSCSCLALPTSHFRHQLPLCLGFICRPVHCPLFAVAASPGMQWMSTGSGVEHAEGGGTPTGEPTLGFQIWVNVPSAQKSEDPRYGTEPPENIPVLSGAEYPGVTGRILAGEVFGLQGPFSTVQPVHIVDYVLTTGAAIAHSVPPSFETCIVYCYSGAVRRCL